MRRIVPAPVDSEPTRCRARSADLLGTAHRCCLDRGHAGPHEWKAEQP